MIERDMVMLEGTGGGKESEREIEMRFVVERSIPMTGVTYIWDSIVESPG